MSFGLARGPTDLLFCSIDWHSVVERQRQALASDIANMEANQLLNTATDRLTDYFVDKYRINAPILQEQAITFDQKEIDIDVSQDRNRYVSDRSRSFMTKGMAYDIEVPFDGDATLFRVQPTTFNMNPPRGEIRGNSLFFRISGTNLEAAAVRASIDRTIASVRGSLEVQARDAAGFNSSLQDLASAQVEQRKKKILNDRDIASAIGFPMKRRDGAPATFVAPEVRRKVSPSLPPAAATPYKPEPVLSTEEYEAILGIVEGMVRVMEYSPSAFAHMGEEDLRTHFLVQLNGQYQGQATGETFNYEGKTDILIKSGSKNIFIAECKFWRGEKAYSETLDQLLGYLSWRDTKAAILLFNRNKDFTNVCNSARQATAAHEKCRKEIRARSESSWQFLFSHRDDLNREMLITVLAFDVPS